MPSAKPEIAREALCREARGLLRGVGNAALGTLADGRPYVSFVEVAAALDGSPLLLLSDLAEHSRNLAADPRLSLLLGPPAEAAEKLAAPRLSVVGRAVPGVAAVDRGRYLARHPGAARYLAFADFRLYRVHVERLHLVAGFGRIAWLEAGEVLTPSERAAAFADTAATLDALNGAERAALAAAAGPGCRAAGLDPDGLDLAADGAYRRLPLPLADGALGTVLAALATAARSAAGR